MATHLIGDVNDNFTDKRRTTDTGSGNSSKAGDYSDHDAMDATLLANSYTQAQIDHMTQNDKVYAVRLISDAASI